MGKGGLSFLNKKSFHTGKLRNQERVWKAEEEKKAEDKKVEELKKEIEEDRRREELIRLQREAGLVPDVDQRMSWMVSGPSSGVTASNSRSSGGGADVDLQEEYVVGKELKESSRAVSVGKISKGTTSAVDMYSKLNEDPLVGIMQQRERMKNEIKSNPVLMKRIKDEIRGSSRRDSRSPSPDRRRSSRRRDDDSYDNRQDRHESSRSRHRSSRRRHRRRDSRSPSYSRHRQRSRSLDSRSHSHSRRRRYSRSPLHSRRRRDSSSPSLDRRRKSSRNSRHSRNRRYSRSPSPDRHEKSGRSYRHHKPKKITKRYSSSPSPPRITSSNSARTTDRKRQSSKPSSKLTPAEMSARRSAMQRDAEIHDSIRKEYIREYDEASIETTPAEPHVKPAFINNLNKEIYENNETRIQDRLHRNRHYRQKGDSDYHQFI